MLGLQGAGKTTLVNVIAVRPGSALVLARQPLALIRNPLCMPPKCRCSA